METLTRTSQSIVRWHLPAMWLAPWALYLSSVAATIAASYFGERGTGWLLTLTKDGIILTLAILVGLLWLACRVAVVVVCRSPLPAIAGAVLELPLAFLVFLFWAVGMIGGPINPG